VDLVPIRGAFSAEALAATRDRLRLPANFLLVAAGGGRRIADVAARGGVRLVL